MSALRVVLIPAIDPYVFYIERLGEFCGSILSVSGCVRGRRETILAALQVSALQLADTDSSILTLITLKKQLHFFVGPLVSLKQGLLSPRRSVNQFWCHVNVRSVSSFFVSWVFADFLIPSQTVLDVLIIVYTAKSHNLLMRAVMPQVKQLCVKPGTLHFACLAKSLKWLDGYLMQAVESK